MTEYVTVFGPSDVAWQWAFPASGLLMFVLAISVWRLAKRHGKARGNPWFIAAFFGLWLSLASCGTLSDYLLARNGDRHVVEGAVEAFDPMPYAGHKNESFEVDGVVFSYSDFDVTSGFNQTASHGGPVRAGLPVRVTYVVNSRTHENVIVKLEIVTP